MIGFLAVLTAMVAGASLYRIRGGDAKAKFGIGTHVSRLIWSVPTALLLFFAFHLDAWGALLVFVAQFAGVAAVGHGAHMNMNEGYYDWLKTNPPQDRLIEDATFWMPSAWGGYPNKDWPRERLLLWNVVGMTCCGVVRTSLWFLPLVFLGHAEARWLVGTGALHGLAYWAGGTVPRSELIVGALTWGAIVGVSL